MDANVLIAVGLVVIAIGLVVGLIGYNADKAKAHEKGAGVGKKAPAGPLGLIDDGTVARIRMATDDWGTRIHVLLEERPSVPITLAIDAGHSAIPLTQVGDRVRIERNDEEGAEYQFTNLTLGLSVTSEE